MRANLSWWELIVLFATIGCVILCLWTKKHSEALAWTCAAFWQLDYFLEREKNREIKDKNN